MTKEILEAVPHRQVVFTVPRRLRLHFRYDRHLLSKLSLASYRVVERALREAMAAGRPVITTGKGAAYDVIQDEVTGLLVDKGDRSKLAAAILRLAEVALERFPLGRILDETLAAYESAIGAFAT